MEQRLVEVRIPTLRVPFAGSQYTPSTTSEINEITETSSQLTQLVVSPRKRIKLERTGNSSSTLSDNALDTKPADPRLIDGLTAGSKGKQSGPAPLLNMMMSKSDEASLEHSDIDQLSSLPLASTLTLTFATAADLGVTEQDVPTTVTSIASHHFRSGSIWPAWRIVGLCTIRMRNDSRALNPEETQIVYNILKSFNSLPTITSEANTALKMRPILQGIQGEISGSEAAKASKPFSYPPLLRHNVELLQARLDNDLAVEEAIAQPATPSPRGSSKSASRKQSQSIATPIIRSSDPTLKQTMRGVILSDGNGSRRTMTLDRSYTRREFQKSGHNGLKIGDWWPYRVCLLRDGAHGSLQGGISGSSQRGAWSVVVSSDYSTLDSDHGRVIYYSGSNSHDNEDPLNPHVTAATASLRVSCNYRLPVRVIRSGAANTKHAPSKGFRYEGLYDIVEERVEKNEKGGAYLRFKFVRQGGQDGVDKTRPTRKEGDVFDALRSGVGW